MLSGLKEIHLKTVSVLHKLVSRGYVSGGAWVHCTPYFVMDYYNAPSNVENYINKISRMGVQNQTPIKAMLPLVLNSYSTIW